MALQKSHTKTFTYRCTDKTLASALSIDTLKTVDNIFSTCYINVISCAYSKDTGKIRSQINLYTDSAKAVLIDTLNVEFTADTSSTAKNGIVQTYEYLKTIEEYKDATNVLETGQTA